MATTDIDPAVSFQHIDLQRRGHVAVITLQRPDRLNALNAQMVQELHHAIEQLAGEFPETRAVVITGAGRGFWFYSSRKERRCSLRVGWRSLRNAFASI